MLHVIGMQASTVKLSRLCWLILSLLMSLHCLHGCRHAWQEKPHAVLTSTRRRRRTQSHSSCHPAWARRTMPCMHRPPGCITCLPAAECDLTAPATLWASPPLALSPTGQHKPLSRSAAFSPVGASASTPQSPAPPVGSEPARLAGAARTSWLLQLGALSGHMPGHPAPWLLDAAAAGAGQLCLPGHLALAEVLQQVLAGPEASGMPWHPEGQAQAAWLCQAAPYAFSLGCPQSLRQGAVLPQQSACHWGRRKASLGEGGHHGSRKHSLRHCLPPGHVQQHPAARAFWQAAQWLAAGSGWYHTAKAKHRLPGWEGSRRLARIPGRGQSAHVLQLLSLTAPGSSTWASPAQGMGCCQAEALHQLHLSQAAAAC